VSPSILRPSIYGREHTKTYSSIAALRSCNFVGGLAAVVSDVTISRWFDAGRDGYDK
jgi:hypothetical protein